MIGYQREMLPPLRGMHPVRNRMNGVQREMNPLQREMNGVQREMHPVQREMHPVLTGMNAVQKEMIIFYVYFRHKPIPPIALAPPLPKVPIIGTISNNFPLAEMKSSNGWNFSNPLPLRD
ncbi:MAG: hypothetical protein EOL87_17015 [Spartobacteria bacterium]|nr:hypothetical protein [Spartobacteria bacterium]